MNIEKIAYKDIEKIRPMWEALNRHHAKVASHIKTHFESFTFEQRLKGLEDKDEVAVFTARDDTALSGYCIASAKAGLGEIDSIYIDPGWRKKGVGEELMAAAESWLGTHVSRIQISVVDGNNGAFGFYETLGYQKRLVVFDKETGHDHV